MPINIFLSVGRASTPEQEQFITALEKYLSSNGLTPQTVGRTYFKNQQPLKSVAECIANCAGTIILAFERLHIQDGTERRGSKHQSPIGNVTLPTVWNQIEAAMAYTLGHPLLVLVENGIKSEGLLEHAYDWYVKWIELRDTAFAEPEFIGVFTDWKTAVEKHSKAPPPSSNRRTTEPDGVSNSNIEAILKKSMSKLPIIGPSSKSRGNDYVSLRSNLYSLAWKYPHTFKSKLTQLLSRLEPTKTVLTA